MQQGVTAPVSRLPLPNAADICAGDDRETFPAAELTPVAVQPSIVFMGDKSPKATSKQAAQKKAKANAANQKKRDAASAKQVPKK
jgi:hypothetical protein